MCRDSERDDLGRSDPDAVEDGRNVENPDDWRSLSEVVAGLIRGWRSDAE
jgi:hypothetical protein